MIFDTQNYFSDHQELTASAGSTNVVATGAARRLFQGEYLRFLVWLDAAAKDSDGDETYSCVVQTDDNEGFLSPTDIGTPVSIPRGSAANSKFYVDAFLNAQVEGFLRLAFTLGGTDPEVTVSGVVLPANWGAVNEANHFYPTGYTIAS